MSFSLKTRPKYYSTKYYYIQVLLIFITKTRFLHGIQIFYFLFTKKILKLTAKIRLSTRLRVLKHLNDRSFEVVEMSTSNIVLSVTITLF